MRLAFRERPIAPADFEPAKNMIATETEETAMINNRLTDKELEMFAAEPQSNLLFAPNHTLAQMMARKLLALRRCGSVQVEVANAMLKYIDTIPANIAGAFDTVPGLDRDWAEEAMYKAKQLVLIGKMQE